MKPLIIALGGNALIHEHQLGNFKQQLQNVTSACKEIAALAKRGTPLVLTHGNGPQVGNLELQMKAASPRVPTMPLDVEGGMTQGQIGHLLFLGLKKWLPRAEISSVLTHVEVSVQDSAFSTPSKPIGPWYKTNQYLKREKIPFTHDPKKGFRRVVASPEPKKILELEAIETLLKQQHIVIACGGGGVPVVQSANGWRGVEAVIDKDHSTQVLANALHAKEMAILTNEPFVYQGYYSGKPKPLTRLSLVKAKQLVKKGEFGAGSMRPKVEASMRFIQKGGKTAYIGQAGKLEKVLNHESGTRVRG